MTFLEAAIEILRQANGAMHFAEVARLAVEESLLSHVGRDPEAAMRSCLNSAVRAGRDGQDSVIMREKPGYYGIRPGAALPDSPQRPKTAAEKKSEAEQKSASNSDAEDEKPKPRSSAKKSAKTRSRKKSASGTEPRKRRKTRTRRGEAPPPETVEVSRGKKRVSRRRVGADSEKNNAPAETSAEELPPANNAEAEPLPEVEFEAPSGSGLEGVTDVALVMANAMSRLVDERPELKDELEAMQQAQAQEAAEDEPPPPPPPQQPPRQSSRSQSSGNREVQVEERSSRRRRRRRRRGKRVDWSAGGGKEGGAASMGDSLLDGVASVLEDTGPRSLHVRQIAETLATRGVLGGEVSEIERAVTSAILIDLHQSGRASRFVARGDARYQLQGTRLPEKAAAAERALREAIQTLNTETGNQLVQWLHTLGARALESLVRIYLRREGYQLVSALPPGRGVGKLVIDDPDAEDDNARALAVVIPRRTGFDPKLWEGEVERNSCGSLLLVAMCDIPEDGGVSDARVIGPPELGAWLREHGVGVQSISIQAAVLDPTVIESIAGLDT